MQKYIKRLIALHYKASINVLPNPLLTKNDRDDE